MTAVLERDIPQSTRNDMPASEFAGPDQSFPIAKKEDIVAAAHLIGKADNPAAVKARIIAIAKKHGWEDALPDAWQPAQESAPTHAAILSESLDLSEASPLDGNVIRGVVLIRAGMSKNRRYYSEKVLQTAAPVFEGAKAYNDHAKQHRATDITGWYGNVRYVDGALRADRYFAPTQAGKDMQALAGEIVSGRAPSTLAGLSIAAEGKVKNTRYPDGDALEVESISAAESVDDVANPAAGGTYLAAAGLDTLTAAYLNDLSYEEFLESRPEYVERLRKEFKRVRQEDALKSAEAETQRLMGELQEAQTEYATLTEASDTALAQRDEAQRALLIEQALNAVSLPASWKEDLRKKLIDTAPGEWAAVLTSEKDKARSAGIKPRVDVHGAGQQVNEAVKPLPSRDLNWQPDELLGDWIERISR